MKQLLQRTFALRAIVLVVLLTGMVSRIWAEDVTVTYTFTSRNWTATVDGAAADWTFNKQGAGFSNNGIQVTTSATGANGTTPVEYSNITKIVATYNTNTKSGAGTMVAQIGNNAATTKNWAYSSGDGRTANYTTEFNYETPQSGAVTITLNTTTNSIYLVSIAITYEEAIEEIEVTGISLDKEEISLEVGTTETLTAIISPKNATNKTVTWSSSNEDVVTVADDGVVTAKSAGTATITATSEDGSFTATCDVTVTSRNPVNITGFGALKTELVKGESVATEATNDQSGWTASYTYTSSDESVATIDSDGTINAVSKGTATISAALNIAANDANFKLGETTSLSIEIEVVNPSHTVTFSVNGNTDATNTFEEGASITFPTDVDAVEEKELVGWVETPIDNVTDEAPSFVTAATMGEADKTYYAVFATKEGTEKNESVTIQGTTSGFPTSYAAAEDYTLEGVTFNILQVYKNNNGAMQWRAAGNSNGTGTMYNVDAINGLQSIVITYTTGDSKKNFTLCVGTNANPTSGTAITATASDLTYTFDCSGGNYSYFVLTNGENAGYLASIVINYKKGDITYSGYCTTVAADTREEAGISFTEAAITQELMAGYTGQALTNPNNLTVTFTSSNEQVATIDESGTLTVLAVGETTITATFAGNENYKGATASYVLTIEDNRSDAEMAFSANAYTATMGEENVFPTLTNQNELTVSYASSDETVATIDPTTGAITLLAEGTTTITATFDGNNEYKATTTSYTLKVYDPYVKGREKNPYTVAEAVYAIDNAGTTSNVYVTGIVSQVDSYSSGAITYWISADGTTTDQFEVYRGLNIGGANFKSADDVQVGDAVVVYGDITFYARNSIYEFSANSQLVSLKRQSEADLAYEITEYQINVNDEFQAPTLSNPHNLTVTYSSSNEDLAFVNETTGELLITENAEGVVTITATFAGNDDYKAGSASYTLTIVDNSKTPVTLAFSEESYTADLDEEFTAPVLSSDVADLTFTYASDNEEVAMVKESTGEVVLMSTGTAVITATFAGNDTYASATASYTLIVTQAKTLPYEQDFTSSFGDWTQNGADWTQNSSYGAVINVTSAGTYDLISPEIRLTANKQINVAINHAGRYLNSTYQDECQLLVKAAGGEWEAVPVTTWFTNTNWTYVDAAMVLDQKYAGQKVQFALRYAPQTNPSASGKWEVKSFCVTATELPKPEPTLAFEQESYSVEIGGELTITASSDESDGTITYTSSDENIAMIDASTGKVLAGDAEGVVTITATIAATESYASATASVQLTITDSREVATVIFADVPESIIVNTSAIYVATAFDGAEITYTSSATNVVTVDETTGEILALAEGVATITATTAATATYKAGSASYTITVVDPNKTYYALVGEYDNKYYALTCRFGSGTFAATEVEAVNGKVISTQTDAIAWEIVNENDTYYLKNKAKGADGYGQYIGHGSSTSLTLENSHSNNAKWTADTKNNSWVNDGRSFIYKNGTGFKNYATSNVNGTGYGSYTHAYTFADGYVRTVTAGNWGTFCVDHTIAAADYSGVTFYSIAGKDKENNPNYLSLKKETGELLAGVAYIFQANEGATKLLAAYSDESITEPFEASDNNGLAGSFTGQDVEEGMYLLSAGKIVKCGTGCTIAANRAYIDMDAVPVLGNESASEGLVKLFLGTTDAVRGIDADNLNGAVIYDLSGRRLQNAQRGLYIVNGKKVAVK